MSWHYLHYPPSCFFLPSLLQHLTISLPHHVISDFSAFFIISYTNVLRRLLSMFNDVCYRLSPRLSRIMCSVRLNLGVFENNESFKHLLGFLRPEDRNSIQPLFTKTASMSKNGHTRKSLYPQWIETGSERTCLLLVTSCRIYLYQAFPFTYSLRLYLESISLLFAILSQSTYLLFSSTTHTILCTSRFFIYTHSFFFQTS